MTNMEKTLKQIEIFNKYDEFFALCKEQDKHSALSKEWDAIEETKNKLQEEIKEMEKAL